MVQVIWKTMTIAILSKGYQEPEYGSCVSYGGIRKSLRQDIILKTVKYNKKRIQGKTQCEEGSSIITTESDSFGAGKNVEVEG